MVACSFRTRRIDQGTRGQRLHAFVEPVKAQWRDESLGIALQSFDGFCRLTGLDKAQEYLARHRIHGIADWGAVKLDAEGLALQDELEHKQTVSLGFARRVCSTA